MSVPVGMRSESKLVAQVKANELAKYTLEITSNQRVFSPRFDALTRRIVDNAFGIGQSIWMANDINVRSAEDYSKRHGLQRDALLECDALLYNITLAKTTFHLSSKRVEHWSGLTREVKALIRAWRDSDAKKCRHLVSGK